MFAVRLSQVLTPTRPSASEHPLHSLAKGHLLSLQWALQGMQNTLVLQEK